MAEYGWLFPPECDPVRGRVRMTDYEGMIRQSVRMILSTRKGERFLHPEFGCDIVNYLFQPVNYTTIKQMENEVMRSIKAWEPRISDLEVQVEAFSHMSYRVNVEVSYFIPVLNVRMIQRETVSAEASYGVL